MGSGWRTGAIAALLVTACSSKFDVEALPLEGGASGAKDSSGERDDDLEQASDASTDDAAVEDAGRVEELDSAIQDSESTVEAGVDAALEAGADAGVCPVVPGLLGWWKGNSNPNDSAGSHHGVWNGSATYVSAKVGKGMYFDGASRVDVADANDLDVTSAYSVDAWISVGAANKDMRIVNKATAFAADGFLLDVFGGKLRLFSGGGSVQTVNNLPIATLVHVAATLSGNAAVLYVNGVAAATEPSKMFPSPKNALPFRIGQDSQGGTPFIGTIDELALYGRSLSASEIAAIYARGANGRCP